MAEFIRRTFLSGSALAAASVGAANGLLNPAEADAATCGGPVVQRFGPAALSAAIVSMTVVGNRAYVVTRGQTPPVLAEVDLATRKLLRKVRLPRGDGAWAMTSSNGKVYIGTYPYPDVYRFDPATGGVTRLNTIGPTGGFVWCLTTAPDGTVYAGTFPRGEVWEYKPGSNTWRNLGVAKAGQQYVRGIAADDKYVYAGALPIGYLIRYNRSTGQKVDISPVRNATGIGVVLAANGRVLAGAGEIVMNVRPDGTDPRILTMQDRLTDAMALGTDGVVYHTGRPSGGVLKTVGSKLQEIAAPVPGDEHRGIKFINGGKTLLGAAGRGELWWLDMKTRASTRLDLLTSGLAGPETAQSIALDPGRTVFVGGSSSITMHDPWRGTRRLVRVAGEPKQMRFVGGRLYCALYPSCEVIEVEPGNGRWRSYGRVEHSQFRPLDLEYDPASGLLLMSSAPVNGQLTGALTLIRPRRGEYQVYPALIPGQAITSVTVGNGIAYMSGDTVGVSVPSTRTAASIVAFDLATRKKLWEVQPLPGYTRMQHLAYYHGLIYGTYRAPVPRWFVFDPKKRQMHRHGKLPMQGEVYVHRNRVFATTYGGNIYQIGPNLASPKLVVNGLGTGWYNVPQIVFEPTTNFAWGTADRSLARIRVDPACVSAATLRGPSPGFSQKLVDAYDVY